VNETKKKLVSQNQRKIHFTHTKDNNILNIVCVFSFQQHLPSKHHRFRDSKLAEWIRGLRLVTQKLKKKVHVNLEQRSAHGQAVKK